LHRTARVVPGARSGARLPKCEFQGMVSGLEDDSTGSTGRLEAHRGPCSPSPKPWKACLGAPSGRGWFAGRAGSPAPGVAAIRKAPPGGAPDPTTPPAGEGPDRNLRARMSTPREFAVVPIRAPTRRSNADDSRGHHASRRRADVGARLCRSPRRGDGNSACLVGTRSRRVVRRSCADLGWLGNRPWVGVSRSRGCDGEYRGSAAVPRP
jgi:hypothetical protein